MSFNAKPALVFAVASGKGGVGKTSICANLGISLARQERRVCIFDADTNLANINILLGLTPQFTIEDFLSGHKLLDDIMLDGPSGIQIVPAASGVADLTRLGSQRRDRLLDGLQTLEREFDYILLDCAAGIGENVLAFMQAASYVVLVITSEPTSLTDAYSLLKVLNRRGHPRSVFILVNRVASRPKAMEVYKRFKGAVSRFIDIKVHSMGYILADQRMDEAVHLQIPSVLAYPDAESSQCFSALARVMTKKLRTPDSGERFTDLWRDWMNSAPIHGSGQIALDFDPSAFQELLKRAGQLLQASPDEARDLMRKSLSELNAEYSRRFPGSSWDQGMIPITQAADPTPRIVELSAAIQMSEAAEGVHAPLVSTYQAESDFAGDTADQDAALTQAVQQADHLGRHWPL